MKTEDIHPPNSGDKNAEIQMFEKSLRIFVTDAKRMRIFTNREEILRKPLQVFIKMNCEKATQMEIPKACGLSKADWCIISRSSRICSWLLWTNMYFIPSSCKNVPIYSRFVPGVYRSVLRPRVFCPNPAQTCLRYA